MKISTAYVCYSCEEILNGAPRGRCTACSSEDVFPLGWFEHTQDERARWLNLIRGSKQNRTKLFKRAA